jgi:CDP-glucose 4,6-dehydratase
MELNGVARLLNLPGPVLVTGHTGFKGSWLTLLLQRLGVEVCGISLPPQVNSLYLKLASGLSIENHFIDIRNSALINQSFQILQPSAVIHLAAQSLVLESYKSPKETFEVNALGTTNILDASFSCPSVEAVIVVTTDKVYRNNESGKAFHEDDSLEGKDPYSSSKVAAEAAVRAWQNISKVSSGPKVVSVRAGNVIGGGDLATGRLLPDLIRGFETESPVEIRNSNSTRPWQHVLDPLTGYLLALEHSLNGANIGSLNFGPISKSITVEEVVAIATNAWPSQVKINFQGSLGKNELEATHLELDSTKARQLLNWTPKWSQHESIAATVSWWDRVLNKKMTALESCRLDLDFLLNDYNRIN